MLRPPLPTTQDVRRYAEAYGLMVTLFRLCDGWQDAPEKLRKVADSLEASNG